MLNQIIAYGAVISYLLFPIIIIVLCIVAVLPLILPIIKLIKNI